MSFVISVTGGSVVIMTMSTAAYVQCLRHGEEGHMICGLCYLQCWLGLNRFMLRMAIEHSHMQHPHCGTNPLMSAKKQSQLTVSNLG